jgi:hypothetical protein
MRKRSKYEIASLSGTEIVALGFFLLECLGNADCHYRLLERHGDICNFKTV